MAFKMGIVGLPMSGKSATFDALAGARGTAAASGSHGRNVRQEVVRVEDPRVLKLAEIYKPKKVTHATMTLVDAPGILDPHSSGSGIGKGYLAQIRDCEGLLAVMRIFRSDNVPHPRETVDPARDLEFLLSDMIIDDLSVIEKRFERIEVGLKKEGKEKKDAYLAEKALLQRIQAKLEGGHWPESDFVSHDERKTIAGFCLFTLRRVLVLANVGDLTDAEETAALEKLRATAGKYGFPVLLLNPALEIELAEFSPAEREEYYASMGLPGAGGEKTSVDHVIHQAYDALGLESFLTSGEDEVRAWTIPKGTTAVHAAGAIHSDLERGFICAEIVHYDDFIEAGSTGKAREKGHLRQEGRDYVVKDGDIMNVRFSV